MEKIKLGSGKELDLIVCGILADNTSVTLKFLPGTDSLDALNTVFTDTDETEKMTLISESGEELAIYNGYTQIRSIWFEPDAVIGYDDGEITGKLVTVVLCKPDEMIMRLAALESQMTDTQLALCEIYEGMV